jgi:D-3-phosphoglycerate dehydrogenase
MIAMSRQLCDRNTELHQGIWNKTSANCHEIRSKTVGIIGYGHIGSQLSVLCDSMGMSVIYYDILQIMPLGNAKPCSSLLELLKVADFVTLHVPETLETKDMIGSKELAHMKNGSYLINGLFF